MSEFAAAVWFPVLTLLIGFGTKSLSDWVDYRRNIERDRAARDAAAKEKLRERRTELQHKTLLDLQEACLQLSRSTSAMHHQDIMTLRRTGEWQKQLFEDDLSENARLANAKTMMLATRVRDDAVRCLVNRFKDYCAEVNESKNQQSSEKAMTSSMAVFADLNQRIGELLRDLDDAEK